VMERLMTDVMYEIPSDLSIQSVTITKACVENGAKPLILCDPANLRQPIRRGIPHSTQVF